MSSPDQPMEDTDPLDSLLDLENQFYSEGYALGLADGAQAAKIEGRSFGLEKGFEKSVEIGRLGGRAAVWKARISSPEVEAKEVAKGSEVGVGVKALGGNGRLQRQLQRLDEVTDPATLSTRNDEQDVDAFDERLREARTKATLISKIMGEEVKVSSAADPPTGAGTATSNGRGLRIRKRAGEGAVREMEDFVSLPGARKS